MEKRIEQCLENKHSSYILPFLWLHGEPRERVREEILAIKNSGANEFCAESRPYERFCQDEWWEDFGFILKTARELGMRVWLLDDKKFPTGYANGYLEKPENAHLRKRLIREHQIEALGPMRGARLYVGGRVGADEKIIKVIAYRHAEDGDGLDYRTAIDLTHTVCDDMAYWDIPSGAWRVCVTVESAPYEYKDSRFFYYIDMLSPDSCHAMIDAIYQPHYDHFKEYFGNTFAGFFSDEPGFLNLLDTYHNTLGIIHSPYPWREDLPALIAKSAGIDEQAVQLSIPALWEDLGEITPLIRAHYMEVVTRLYSESFGYQLGNWCREHGVMYIGHVIEDMDAHMRLAYGSGHYFRALDGQDMAGVDIVLMQDIPGVSSYTHISPLADGGKADPAFFRYTLPKLASSHSHIQPLKNGRAMCELFGAFGWAEGLPYMKGLADIMLVGGINHFVPHAFSAREEDEDCPPHFYNGGKNIQYPLFKNLMNYMGRCSHMLSDGVHRADACVFYNAEGEWTSGKNQPFSSICSTLARALVDFDIVPYDALRDAKVKNGRICINKEDYGALIISKSEIMPIDRLECFKRLADEGVPVIFTDELPKRSAEGIDISSLLPKFELTPTKDLAKELRKRALCHVSARGEGIESLRFYHISREEREIYLFSNEAIYDTLDAEITLPEQGECLIYEPWENKIYRTSTKDGTLHLRLENGNMLFVIFGEEIPESTPYYTYEVSREPLSILFDISTMDEEEGEFSPLAQSSRLFDITAPDCKPHFSGSIRYTTSFEARDGFTVIDLGQVGEVAEAWLNGKYLGARINPPYKFNMAEAIRKGKNELEIIVKTNLAHRRRDSLSSYLQIPPSGILGDISLCKYSK